MAACEQKKAAAALQRRTVALAQKQAMVLERQVDLGEVKRVDYMAAQTQLARDTSGQLESVLALLEAERELERLLGMRAGDLAGRAVRWEEEAAQ
jgi:outer membrane protein TolC